MTLNEAICALREAGVENPEFDARELFIHFGKLPRHAVVSRSVSLDDEIIAPQIEQRAKRKPLQYLIGELGFYRESYEVSPDCLIPREDTEILVDFAVKNIPEGESFIDLCTGSGCIAISTLKNTKGTNALAIDISEPALAVAKRNAVKNGVSERVRFSVENALAYKPCEKVFAILSNPPYVTEDEYENLEAELYFEPKLALVGNDNGLEFYKKITKNTNDFLKPEGFIAFEIGKDQADALIKIAEENEMQASILNDFSGNPRVAVMRKAK